MPVKLLALTCVMMTAALPAAADTFLVQFGGRTLGQLNVSSDGRTTTLRSTLGSTPMGVFNGAFVGTSSGNAQTARFTGETRSSRKERVVTVDITAGRATATIIVPPQESTDLSDITRVPPGVTDPVRTFVHLLEADGCPGAVQMYDGRRLVRLTLTGERRDGMLMCNLDYRVVAGPGHLSPLRIASAKIELSYARANAQQILQGVRISSGIFAITLERVN